MERGPSENDLYFELQQYIEEEKFIQEQFQRFSFPGSYQVNYANQANQTNQANQFTQANQINQFDYMDLINQAAFLNQLKYVNYDNEIIEDQEVAIPEQLKNVNDPNGKLQVQKLKERVPQFQSSQENVHDSGITQQIITQISNFDQNDQEIISSEQFDNIVYNFVLERLAKEFFNRKQAQVLNMFEAFFFILKTDAYCEAYKCSELTLLKNCLKPIINCISNQEKCTHEISCQTKLDNFALDLSNMIDNGEILCLMGRMARIMDCFGNVHLQLKNTLEKEIGAKCLLLFNKLNDEEKNLPNIDELILNQIKDEYQEIISVDELRTLLKKWFCTE